jgi:hypothetical protein
MGSWASMLEERCKRLQVTAACGLGRCTPFLA